MFLKYNHFHNDVFPNAVEQYILGLKDVVHVTTVVYTVRRAFYLPIGRLSDNNVILPIRSLTPATNPIF